MGLEGKYAKGILEKILLANKTMYMRTMLFSSGYDIV